MNNLFADDKTDEKDAIIASLTKQLKEAREQKSGPAPKPLSFYNELKKTDPAKYADTRTKLDIERDSQLMGAAFFDTDEPQTGSKEYNKYTGPNAIYRN
jgi:hypothetical protein